MKILVTGGVGYIGSVAVDLLLQRGFDVIVYDNLSTGFRHSINPQVEFIMGDVRDQFLLGRVIKDKNIEAVMHFASKLIVSDSVVNPYEYYDNNVLGAMSLLEACRQNNVKKIIFSSSASVYGDVKINPVSEDSPIQPINPYGTSKAIVEKMLLDYSQSFSIQSVSLRYFNVAGATVDYKIGQRTLKATNLIKVAAEAACGKRTHVDIFGSDYSTKDGTGVRDYIHISDLVSAHILALEYLNDGGRTQSLNCGYSKGYSVNEVIDSMRKVSHVHFPTRLMARRAGDPAEVIADATKLVKMGWVPQYNDLDLICQTAFEWERRLKS